MLSFFIRQKQSDIREDKAPLFCPKMTFLFIILFSKITYKILTKTQRIIIMKPYTVFVYFTVYRE